MNIACVMGLPFFEEQLPQMHKNSTKPQSYSALGLQWIRGEEGAASSLKVSVIKLISGSISQVTSKVYTKLQEMKKTRSLYAIPAMSNQRGKQA